ncbi:G-protein coupled receptor dmsr-1 [Arctopsyche grandis]|uniref:G-protein coupled receptor dmsr-1 n=1 Tax=Arctopsyche grandis TaxID=121162 RepID=UPI00406D7061
MTSLEMNASLNIFSLVDQFPGDRNISFGPSLFEDREQNDEFMMALKEKDGRLVRNGTIDMETLIRRFNDMRMKFNVSWMSDSPECLYCSGNIKDVVTSYNNVHGYISLLVCVFGTFANILNIAVLTRKDMANAPINRILKWLAVTDMFVMIEYIPFASYKYLVLPGQMDFPKPWAVYLLFHMHFAQILHTISICLTLSLAVWRYIAIRFPHLSHLHCSERRCSAAVLTSFLLPPLLCAPTYVIFHVHTTVVIENETPSLLYHVDTDYEGLLYHVNFWIHAVVIKLLPCLILTVISIWLINALYMANKRKLALRGYSSCPANAKAPERRQSKSDKRADRTTKMLVAVLLLFLITEIPQGVLGLMSGILGQCFFKGCYNLFGEMMDILALLNGAINFILYCSMSRQFRMTFGQLFKPKILAKWPTNGSQTEVQSTYV